MNPQLVTAFLAVYHSSVLHSALVGALAAAGVDYHAFLTWKSFGDIKTYQWNIALFRWVQGAVIGALATASIAGIGA